MVKSFWFKLESRNMEVRVDKWLWAVRVFKTRSQATEACKKGRVLIGGTQVKPSRIVKVGEVIQVKRPPVLYSFKVIALAQNRMNAKLVSGYMEHVTTPDQLQLLELVKLDQAAGRARGTGRPTKKERRDLDEFVDDTPFFMDDDWEFGEEDEAVEIEK